MKFNSGLKYTLFNFFCDCDYDSALLLWYATAILQMSIFHLRIKLLFICFSHCEASLSLGKVLYKIHIIIIIHDLALCNKNIARIYG